MDAYNDRLKYLLDSKGVTPYYLSRATNVSQATISRLKSDKTAKPSIATNKKLAKYFNVDETWLLTGQGEMLVRDESDINVFGNGNALGASASVTNNTTYGSCSDENSRADATLNKVLDMLQSAQDRINEIQTQLTEHNSTSTKMLDMLQEKDALILRLTNKLLDK